MKHSGFNPKARWDRNIPETAEAHNPTELNERIEVLAYFKHAKIHPRLFFWKGKRYRIKNINYNWQERSGAEIINYFSVDTGTDLYQISFNNTSYSWRIDKIIA
jgi:hypothetical protein